MTQHSAACVGTVRHRRYSPKRHHFRYPLCMVYLDLDELDRVFALSRLWSLERFNLVSFRRADYLDGASGESLTGAIAKRILLATGLTYRGRIRVLTQLRYWGLCFNPVTFYFCFDPPGEQLLFIVAEVSNTPWNERHAYVLPADQAQTADGGNSRQSFNFAFDKAFHVSPFLPMELRYSWRVRLEDQGLRIHMRLTREQKHMFDATLSLRKIALTANSMRTLPFRYPWIGATVLRRIYWHALLLWLKRMPFFPHPGNGHLGQSKQL